MYLNPKFQQNPSTRTKVMADYFHCSNLGPKFAKNGQNFGPNFKDEKNFPK